ncbi:MAG: DUF4062 domain-containing protein [Rhodothermales bacterium]|nr:DUF4062 domain-containing protein [Rhodothermales bacterium]
MKTYPVIFLSGVSAEFASFRDAVANVIETKECHAINQPGFATDYREVEQMLRGKLKDAEAVVHLVGFRYGVEPNVRVDGAPRRSYTQMEFYMAREMGIPVFVFLAKDATVRDAPADHERPEATELTALQLAHREAVRSTNHIYYEFADKDDLCRLVAQIPPVVAAGFRVDIDRIVRYAPAELVGRESEFDLLDKAWEKAQKSEPGRPHVLTFVALGGEGKTSLVAKWLADMASHNWPGCEGAFAWSFYSQGSRDQHAASSDLFLREALTFFGDPAMADSPRSAYDKGKRLAELVGRRRALLVLDGLEPLQYAPTSPTPGELKDQGLTALLKGLAASSQGLCLVTTRYAVTDLRAYLGKTVVQHDLLRLSTDAGVHLLEALGVTGARKEKEALVEEVKGHALTINLLGSYLARAHGGDVRRRDRVGFQKADARTQDGHAFRAMAAYERRLAEGGEEGKRELAILRLMGLFDRPADAGCIAALRNTLIPDLTEPLVDLDEEDWEFSLTGLEAARLLTATRNAAGLVALESHPLLREYFAARLKNQHPDAWRAGHRRLYEYLTETTHEGDTPTLEQLQPLYQAVAHGCLAGLWKEVHNSVYRGRILRGNKYYNMNKIGAIASSLDAVSYFFSRPWTRVVPEITGEESAIVFADAAYYLRSLGRISESLVPFMTCVSMCIEHEYWEEAAIQGSNLSEVLLYLGQLNDAKVRAEEAVTSADKSNIFVWRSAIRTTAAEVLVQAGNFSEALNHFKQAEKIYQENSPDDGLLQMIGGFRYCELLAFEIEKAAWLLTLGGKLSTQECSRLVKKCGLINQRANRTFEWAKQKGLSLLTKAMDNLTIARTNLYSAILGQSTSEICQVHLEHSLFGLRQAGVDDQLPRGLLTRAWYLCTKDIHEDRLSAVADLDEAYEIAQRGPMPIYSVDIHLYRVRLYFNEEKYPWESPAHDLAEARLLMKKIGYWRRKEELEDAEKAILPRAPS